MPDPSLPVIFHSGGELVWDHGSPVYIGGCPKMAFLKTSITYSQLVQRACDLSNRSSNGHSPVIQYLYQNCKVCTLVCITNDEDVQNMFIASAGDASALYLYIHTGVANELEHQGKAERYGTIELVNCQKTNGQTYRAALLLFLCREGSSKGVRASNPPTILGKRDPTGHILYRGQNFNTNSRIYEDAISRDTLPSPRINPTMKVYGLATKPTTVVKEERSFQQLYPSVDLGADSDLPFTQGCYTCTLESPVAKTDVGLGADIDNLNWLHVDKERWRDGGYTSRRGEPPYAENGVGLVTDNDNLFSLHVDTDRCRMGYNREGDKLPFAEKEGGRGIDNIINLDSSHVDTDGCKEVPAGYGLGSSWHTEFCPEKIQTRNATGTFVDIPSNDSEGPDIFIDGAECVLNQPAINVRTETDVRMETDARIDTETVDTMQAADDLLNLPPREETQHEMWKGRVFNSRDAFKKTLSNFALYNNFCLKPIRTNRFEATARCSNSTCPWRIHASIVEAGPQFQVRTYMPEHTCTGPLNGTKFPQATSVLIAEFIRERLRVNPAYRPKEIMSDFQREFGVQISYRKAHLAKEIAMKQIRGSFEDSYRILCDYRLELKRTNPGTIDNLWTEDDHSFQRYYVCFGGCVRSFKTALRPLIALDGTHLRGKYPGVLLIAVCQDGDHGLFPLAFAIAESECYATWSWFLANLDETLEHVRNLTIVSDRMKGLTNAVRDVLPTAKHCYCCRHISQNIQAKFKNDAIVMKFWCAARSSRVCEYENYMAEIRSIDLGAHDYISAIGAQHWANAFIEGKRYDMLTTNIAESTNSLLKDIRELPITQQIESIRAKLMEFYQTRREKGLNMKTRVTPYAIRIITREAEVSRRLQCWQAGEEEFQVLSPDFTDVVHLDRKTCTCRRWDLLGIPCAHCLCAIELKRYDPFDFCEQWFSSDCYRATYNDVIHATRDGKQWELRSDERVLPPVARRQPGRPKKCRIRTEDRMRKQVTCSHCKKRGHNRQTCREPPPRG